jgi:hypothetical protein
MSQIDEEKAHSAYLEHAVPERRAKMDVKGYLLSRVPTLKPTMAKPPNPFKLLGLLNKKHWTFFGVAMAAWTWDAFVSSPSLLTPKRLTKEIPGLLHREPDYHPACGRV